MGSMALPGRSSRPLPSGPGAKEESSQGALISPIAGLTGRGPKMGPTYTGLPRVPAHTAPVRRSDLREGAGLALTIEIVANRSSASWRANDSLVGVAIVGFACPSNAQSSREALSPVRAGLSASGSLRGESLPRNRCGSKPGGSSGAVQPSDVLVRSLLKLDGEDAGHQLGAAHVRSRS